MSSRAGSVSLDAGGSDSGLVPLDLPRRLLGLDVVRAIAAGMVFLSHMCEQVLIWSPSPGASGVSPILRDQLVAAGAFGVGLFFVLSGLCIHLPMARRLRANPRSRLDLKAYFRRRFTRIYPPHFVVLVLSAVAALLLPLSLIKTDLLSKPTLPQFIAHVFMVHTFIPSAIFSINGVLWTIALETHFYVLYPLLLLARRRYAPWTICLFLLAVSMVEHAVAILFLPPIVAALLDQSVVRRYWEWALGFLVAERLVASGKVGSTSPWLGPTVLLAGFVLGNLVATLPMGGAIRAYSWPFMFALAVAVFAKQRTSRSALERIAVWVGFTSYSLYLTHPIAIPLAEFALRSIGLRSAIVRAAGDLFVGVAFSTVFFFAVERPFMRRAVLTDKRRLGLQGSLA